MSLKKDILWRVAIVYIAFLLMGLAIIGRIVYLQVFEKGKYDARSNEFALQTMVIPADRGSIYAADGRLLASSVPYYEIRFDAKCSNLTDRIFNRNIDSLSICLSRLFRDKPAQAWKRDLTLARRNGNRYYLVKKGVNYTQLKELKNFPIFRLGRYSGGLIYMQETKRVRPLQNLAGRLIGYTTQDPSGNVVGIEGAYNEHLSGTEGIRLMQKLSGNVWMPMNDKNEIDPRDGQDVITTIDIELQDVAHRALLRQLVSQDAHHGTAVVMEVKTGEIKAMVNLGKDENGYYQEIQNYAVGESTEPGSTFKLPMIIAALEEGVVDLDDSVDTGNGILQHFDITIRDDQAERGGYGKLTVEQVFSYSSNVGMAKIILGGFGEKEEHLVDRLYSMRLNEKLGVDILGEGAPEIKYPDDKLWSGVSLAMMSYGYEVRMTPLQTLTFYNAIANDGRMVKPRFVKELRYHGKTIKQFGTETLKASVCSRSTLRKVRQMLESVVENGTAKNLNNDQFKIAGKTGTNQIYNKEYGYKSRSEVSYQASFVGYFPADEPRYSCIVVVNSPSRYVYYGNQVAGPVFLEIAKKVYATATDMHPAIHANNGDSIDLPYSKDGNRKELRSVLQELDLPFENNKLDAQWVNTERNPDVISFAERKVVDGLVPNVVGMGLKDAIYLLENAGLRVRFSGYGSVRHQSIQPGAIVRKGEQIILEMSKT